MKKTLALLLAVLMLVSVLSACGTTAETPAAPTAEATAETMGTETPEEESALEAQDLIFATMDVGTSIYTYSSAIANILLEYLPERSRRGIFAGAGKERPDYCQRCRLYLLD